jgi:purine-binding chemotaxis protein CheW
MSEGIVKHKSAMPSQRPRSRRPEELPQPVSTHEYIAFELADETYALPLTTIREILKLPPVTEVPRAPADVLGIISVRGRVTTIVDLRRRLRMPTTNATTHTRVLLVDSGEEIVGLLVDRVLSVYRLRDEEVELAASVGSDTAEYVRGIGRPASGGRTAGRRAPATAEATEERLLILLDPKALFGK